MKNKLSPAFDRNFSFKFATFFNEGRITDPIFDLIEGGRSERGRKRKVPLPN